SQSNHWNGQPTSCIVDLLTHKHSQNEQSDGEHQKRRSYCAEKTEWHLMDDVHDKTSCQDNQKMFHQMVSYARSTITILHYACGGIHRKHGSQTQQSKYNPDRPVAS